MLCVRVVIGGDSLDVSGAVTLAEVLPLVHDWIAALPEAAQRSIDALTARGAAANRKLEGAVDAATPSP